MSKPAVLVGLGSSVQTCGTVVFISLQTLLHQPLPPTVQCMLPVSSQLLGTEGLLSQTFLTHMMKGMNAAALPLRPWQKWDKQMLGSPCTILVGAWQLQMGGERAIPRGHRRDRDS